MSQNETKPVSVEHGDAEPVEHVQCGSDEEQSEPEPDEDEDLLVEDVDDENALDTVTLVVAEHTHFEIALEV